MLEEYDQFVNEYYKKHSLCPKCKSKLSVNTLMAYIVDLDHKEDFKDLNTCKCITCRDTHTIHDRIEE